MLFIESSIHQRMLKKFHHFHKKMLNNKTVFNVSNDAENSALPSQD